MQVSLVLNPDAGRGAMPPDQLRRAVESAGHRVELRPIRTGDMAAALRDPGDLVVVAGGDGTVGRAMKAMAGSPVALAILPTGTANNIATSLGIRGDPERIAASWAGSEVRPVDIGLVAGPWGQSRFVESVGIGLLGHLIGPEVGDDLDGTDEARAEARRAARTLRPLERRVELDGRDLTGAYLLLEAMNIRCAGPNLWLADHARSGDGKLEVVRALERDRSALVALADAFGTSRSTLPTERGTRLTVWCRPDELHVDDEHGTALGKWEGEAPVTASLGAAKVGVLR
ncbi:MAG TPA: diacylglycerol kinase family protein [Gemmatimonadales bacterium]|jgi:diacylglycerol kinase family enzyme|nr:diacylglycerol kinase family protein [Gemmatimonadales bacterium]